MADTKQIYDFAQRYLRIFTEPDPPSVALGPEFARVCYGLGFKMDLGENFMALYPGDAFYDTAAFLKIATSIRDPYILGTAIFSRWRLITHWQEESVLTEDNRSWFIAALGRLAELTAESGDVESAFKGEIVKLEIVSNNSSTSKKAVLDEMQQSIVVTSDGRVTYQLGRPNADNLGHTFIWNEPTFRIDKEATQRILNAISIAFPYMYSGAEDQPAQDVPAGTWKMVLTNQWGRPYRTAGELGMEILVDGENLSDIIRESIGKSDLLVFDGNPDFVNRLEIRYRRGVPLPQPTEATENDEEGEEESSRAPSVRWEYKEQVVFDRATAAVEHALDGGAGHRARTSVVAHEAVPEFLDELDPERTFSAAPGNPEDAVAREGEITEYQIAMFTKYGNTKVFSGSYDAKSVPPQWTEFLDKVLTFLSFYEYGELFDEGRYGRALRRESDYVYVLIVVGSSDTAQWFLSDDPSLIDGDTVIVPFDGKEELGQVIQIIYGSKEDAPVTFNALKKVVRKITQQNLIAEIQRAKAKDAAEASAAPLQDTPDTSAASK